MSEAAQKTPWLKTGQGATALPGSSCPLPLAQQEQIVLGHGSGGATTLKVYAAWVARADQQASELLASRLPTPRARS